MEISDKGDAMYRFWKKFISLSILLMLIMGRFFITPSRAESPFDDLTPNEVSFVGRRGQTVSVTWDFQSYTATFATPDGTFPWDWISFVGEQGAVALNGYPTRYG
jgi:hypothetical protein